MALTYDGLRKQMEILMERQRVFPPVYIGDEPPKALSDAYRLYWATRTAAEEREAYRKILALGGAPSYGETPATVAALIGEAGAALPVRRVLTITDNTYVRTPVAPDLPSITRDIARGG